MDDMYEVPIPWKPANKTFITTLNDERYRFRFAWNRRAEIWTMSLLTPDETPILLGLPVHLNWSFLDSFRHLETAPPGNLIAICVNGSHVAPGRYELGINRRVRLYYEPVVSA
jgi:hypothetical protein